MKNRSRSIIIFTILFAYIILQFLWWEVLMVRQTGEIINEKLKIVALTSTDVTQFQKEVKELENKKKVKIYMIAGEGTVFLLLMLYGIYRIKKAYEAETQLVNQQKNFVLSVTHELKTPIAATKLQLQTLIKHKQLDAAQQEQLLNSALNETNRLNRLIEDVLLASRADKNELILNKESVNVSEMCELILTTYFGDKLKSGQLTKNIESNISFLIDKVLFPSVVINLIENAFKYSPENPKVFFELAMLESKFLLKISDNGIGISDSEKEKVFLKFYRIGNEETRKTKGTGLGLYIVKQIVEAAGGKIVITNNQPKGSVFTVSL